MGLKHENISATTLAFLKAHFFFHKAEAYARGCKLNRKPHRQDVFW